MRKLVAGLSLFILVLAFLQVLTVVAFPVEIPPEILRLEEYLASHRNIVYLGDSTLSFPAGEVTTGTILQENLPECSVGEIAHPAYNLDLYLHYVRYIARSAHPPHIIVVPINMRSFSPEWDMRPGYQFEKEKTALTLGLFLSRVLWRPLETFGVLDPRISQEDFLNTPVYREETLVGTVRDFEQLTDTDVAEALQGDAGFAYHDALPSTDNEEAMQQVLTYRYMVGLQPDQRQLRAMLDIVKLSNGRDIKVLFYITPVNYQQGERYAGDLFGEVVRKNTDVVKSLLSDQPGTVFLDLSFDLEAFAFVDMEHMREVGKEYVAERLAAAIKPRLPAAFADAGDPPTVVPMSTMTARPTDPPPSPTVTQASATPTPTVISPTSLPVPVTLTPTATPTPAAGGVLLTAEYLSRSVAEGEYAVDVYRLQYETIDQDGEVTQISAELSVPHVEAPTTFPVIVHAAGTTGIGNGCAPLNERGLNRNWGNYHSHSLTYASYGYIVILPNGLGFDDPERIHPYFVAELQARVLLDAARAVYAFADDPSMDGVLAKPDESVFFMGYSSGGHAVFAAKDWAGSYAPDISVKGIMGFGPTTNPETLMREDPIFIPYLVYAYRDFYGNEIVDVVDVLAPQWVATFESDVLTKCVDDIFDYYTRSARTMYTQAFSGILYGGALDQRYPLFAEKLAANASGLSGGHDVPVLILQGTADTVVTPDSQRAFKSQLCDRGGQVTYLEYPAIAHVDIRWTSFGDVLAWMQQIVEGDVPENDCEGLPVE